MRFLVRRLVFATGLLILIPVALAAFHVAAPPAHEPRSSAFQSGEHHLGAWAHDMQSGYDVRAAVSGAYLADADRTLLVVHAPQRLPDAAFLEGHLARGGALWILDPDGTYNPWLSAHGAAVGPHRLVDPDNPHGAGTVRMQGADGEVIARSPASLVLEEGWEPWLVSGAHLDLDGDGTVDRSDTPGPHPVGAAKRVHGAQLFVTADASMLHDGMREGADNRAFANWVVRQLLPHGGRIVVDESQHGWTAKERLPVAAVQSVHLVNLLPTWATLLAAAMVAAGAVLLARKARALHPYREHERSDPATPPGQDPATVEDAAWELLAARTRQPVERLRRAGAEAAHGLAEDPVLRRVLLGRGQVGDDHQVLQDYLHAQNHSNGAKP